MKIDFTPLVTNIDGTKLDGAPSVRDACVTALTTSMEGDHALASTQKFQFGLLAQKIALGEDVVDVTAEEITVLKDRVGKGYSPVVVLFVWQHFERAGS